MDATAKPSFGYGSRLILVAERFKALLETGEFQHLLCEDCFGTGTPRVRAEVIYADLGYRAITACCARHPSSRYIYLYLSFYLSI